MLNRMRRPIFLLVLLLVVSMATGCLGIFKKTYSLSVEVNPDQGTVNLPANAEKIKEGSTVEIKAVPKDGWYFLEWKGDGITEDNAKDNPLELVINKDMVLKALFTDEAPSSYALTVTLNKDQGTIEGLPKDLDEVLDRTLIELEAIPKEGFEFVKWEGDVPEKQINQDKISFRITGDTNISVEFQELISEEAIIHRTGFEGDKLDGWFGRGDTTIRQTEEFQRTGKYSLKITPGEGWSGGPGLEVIDMVELGETYIFRGWVYHTQGEPKDDFIMQMTYDDSAGEVQYDHLETIKIPSHEWVKFEIEYDVPEKITSSGLVFYFEETPDENFVYYLDDVMISKP